MPTDGQIIANLLINLIYTLVVLLIPFAIYRGIKGNPINPKKARRVVIIYMVIYCVLRIALDMLGVFGTESEADEVVNFTAVVFWAWIDIRILSKGYCGEEQEARKYDDDEENARCEMLVRAIEQRNAEINSNDVITYEKKDIKNNTVIPNRRFSKENGFIVIMSIAFFALVISIFAYQMQLDHVNANADADLTPIYEPSNGKILFGVEVEPSGENIDEYTGDFFEALARYQQGSTLTVTAPKDESCYVKLKTINGITDMCFYVRRGKTATVNVPCKKYYVYFATGDTWYGRKHLFGSTTSYSMDDEICDFSEYTYEYTLYPVNDGNFSQTRIDAKDFNR